MDGAEAELPGKRKRRRNERLCCSIVVGVAVIALGLGGFWFYRFRASLMIQSYGKRVFAVSDYVMSRGDGQEAPLREGVAKLPRARVFKDLAAARDIDGLRFEFLAVDVKKVPAGILVFWSAEGVSGVHVGLEAPCREIFLSKNFEEKKAESLRWAEENGVAVEVVVFVRESE